MKRSTDELGQSRSDQSFCVAKSELAHEDYSLSFSRYSEAVQTASAPRDSRELLSSLAKVDARIEASTRELHRLLS